MERRLHRPYAPAAHARIPAKENSMVRIRLGSPAALELALSAAPLLATLPPKANDGSLGAHEYDLIAGNSVPGESKAA
jgi:hypothetical protein